MGVRTTPRRVHLDEVQAAIVDLHSTLEISLFECLTRMMVCPAQSEARASDTAVPETVFGAGSSLICMNQQQL